MSFQDFQLIPADDPQSAPADDLNAAIAGALAVPDSIQPVTPDPPMPFGRTWVFDWQAGQFVKVGQSPAETEGFGAVAQWCEMAVRVARYAHPVFSDEFGMEEPEGVIGSFAEGLTLADWQRHLVDALLVHDRITSVRNLNLAFDPTTGILTILSMDVVTDEDKSYTVSGITMQAGGA